MSKVFTKTNLILAVAFALCIASLYVMQGTQDCSNPTDQVSALTQCNLN